MKEKNGLLLALGVALLLSGCGGTQSGENTAQTPAGVQTEAMGEANRPAVPAQSGETPAEEPERSSPQPETVPSQGQPPAENGLGEIDSDTAFAIALENAGVPEEDVQDRKVERDGDNGIPIYDIEFETEYGDYDFSVAIDGGAIVSADYEVDEEWLDALGGSPVDLEGARQIVAGKVPGATAEEVEIWEESEDGERRYEGELFYGGLKYEFELGPDTGRIFDWNADLRR